MIGILARLVQTVALEIELAKSTAAVLRLLNIFAAALMLAAKEQLYITQTLMRNITKSQPSVQTFAVCACREAFVSSSQHNIGDLDITVQERNTYYV